MFGMVSEMGSGRSMVKMLSVQRFFLIPNCQWSLNAKMVAWPGHLHYNSTDILMD